MTSPSTNGRRLLVFIGCWSAACGTHVISFSRDAGEPMPATTSVSSSSAGFPTSGLTLTSGNTTGNAGMGGGFGSTIGPTTTGSAGVTTTGGGLGGAGGGSIPPPVPYCTMLYNSPGNAATDLVSDFEGNSGVFIQTLQPGGNWILESDGSGTATMLLEPCGTNGIGLHVNGQGHTIWGTDVAATFVSQVQPVNVSAYRGLTFVARSPVPTPLIIKVEAPYSQPACGLCDDTVAGAECHSGYIVTTTTTTDNQVQAIPWQSFFQQSWGYRARGTAEFDPTDLVTLTFAFDKSVDFDVCFDDVKLLRQ